MLSFAILGQVSLYNGDEPLECFRSKKEAALLIYLAQTGRSHRREFIADLLWDGRSAQQAASNLRTVLTRLRKQVGDALVVSRTSVALSEESRQQVDSVFLLNALAECSVIDSAKKADTLERALRVYRGAFLTGFSLTKAPQFNHWVIVTREHLHRHAFYGYERLGQYLLSTGEIQRGTLLARRWLQIDSSGEAAHSLLIRLMLAAGNMREAVAQYDRCVALLRSELDIEPSAELTALIRDIGPACALCARLAPAVRHNLPTHHDQFFGRASVQKEIHSRLDQPWCRLVAIVGQGGVGKTRLATTVARDRLDAYRDGVWLVDLTDIDPDDSNLAEAIAVEIATILDLHLGGPTTPVEQLLQHLRHKQLLLVLDCFDHLLDGVQIVVDILQSCDGVQLLVTSREALQIRAEWVIALSGLKHPASETDPTACEAVDLFLARRMQHNRTAVSADELAAIRAICSAVEGVPLAIELAAAKARHMTCRAIADQLCNGFDILTTSRRDLPPRHRSLRIVFETSWRTLSPELQARLAHLSSIRRSFSQTEAYDIAEAGAEHLAALCDRSLLSRDGATDGYVLPAIVRVYAARKLATPVR